MQGPWLHLRVARGWDVAIPLERVSRLLHRADPDYAAWAPEARSLAGALRVRPAPGLPGVLVVLADGGLLHAGDARLGGGEEGMRFFPLPAYLFERQPPWCRGVLAGPAGWSFLADPKALEALHG